MNKEDATLAESERQFFLEKSESNITDEALNQLRLVCLITLFYTKLTLCKSCRKERNRVHARKTRLRKKLGQIEVMSNVEMLDFEVSVLRSEIMDSKINTSQQSVSIMNNNVSASAINPPNITLVNSDASAASNLIALPHAAHDILPEPQRNSNQDINSPMYGYAPSEQSSNWMNQAPISYGNPYFPVYNVPPYPYYSGPYPTPPNHYVNEEYVMHSQHLNPPFPHRYPVCEPPGFWESQYLPIERPLKRSRSVKNQSYGFGSYTQHRNNSNFDDEREIER